MLIRVFVYDLEEPTERKGKWMHLNARNIISIEPGKKVVYRSGRAVELPDYCRVTFGSGDYVSTYSVSKTADDLSEYIERLRADR